MIGSSLTYYKDQRTLNIVLDPDLEDGGFGLSFLVYIDNNPTKVDSSIIEFINISDSPYNLNCSEYALDDLCNILDNVEDGKSILNKVEIINSDTSAIITTISNAAVIGPIK